MPPNTFKLHSKLGLWVWKSFFANLLYMNACRSLWMLNAVGGVVSMVTFQCTLFLALQLDLHCWAVVNEKVTAQSHLEGWRVAAFLDAAIFSVHWVVLRLSCPISSWCPSTTMGKYICNTHDKGPISLIYQESIQVNMNNTKTLWKKMSKGHK